MPRKKKKFGIDSQYYAYGFKDGKRSHVWYSVLPTRTQRITPLDRLKRMLVDKGYTFIQIYRSPYPQAQPAFEYKTTTGWYEYGFTPKKTSFKLWIVSRIPNGNETRMLSSENLMNATQEAYDLIRKEFNNYSDWKFAVLYANPSKSESLKMMHYSINYQGIKETKDKRNWKVNLN